jgi:hypothetical protein
VTDSSERLTRLQSDVLRAFFATPTPFFLTGGAALVGFYQVPRETRDLDLFATSAADLGAASDALTAAAREVGATAAILQQSPDFRRYSLARGDERTLVDLVIDRAPQAISDKTSFGSIRVDPLAEIGANKLCALLDRVEPRDVFDLEWILSHGCDLPTLLGLAQRKHAGADPASLAFVLSTYALPQTAAVPASTTLEHLHQFLEQLIRALTSLALPKD